MQEVMGELTQMGDIDPAARERLMADLRDTDPKLWPQVVQQFKAMVAFRRQVEQREMLAKANTPSPNTPPQDAVVATGYAAKDAPSSAAATTTAAAGTVWQTPGAGPSQSGPQPLPPTAPASPPASPVASNEPTAAQQAKPATTPAPATTPPATAAAAVTVLPPPPKEAASAQKSDVAEKAPEAPREAGDWRTPLAAAIAAMESELQKTPEGPDALTRQSQLRLLCLVAGRRDDALKPPSAGTPIQREFWTKQVYGLDAWLDASRIPDATRRAAETKRLLDEAAQRLGEAAPLGVRNMAFCTDIQSYGCYKPFKANDFAAEQELLLYVEVENFTSEASAKGFHTALRSSYQIFDTRGQRVADHEFTVTEEQCQNARRDFFIGYHLRLPKRINPGKYTLQLTIEDLKSQKVGQSSIDFSIRDGGR